MSNETPRRATTAPATSVIDRYVRVQGRIEARGEIQLRGRVTGEIRADRLFIAEAAEMRGSIEASFVEVRGQVTGPITARHVRLLAGALVEGDITSELLEVENGAQLIGRCARLNKSNVVTAGDGGKGSADARRQGAPSVTEAIPQAA